MRDALKISRWILAVALTAAGSLRAQDLAAERDLNEPVVLGVSDVFYPYSFRDDDGRLKGFAVDLADAVARVMDLRWKRVVLRNPEVHEAITGGRVDVIQFWSETPARRSYVDFSVPIVRFETVAVVRKGEKRIRRLSDLKDVKDLKIAVGQRGTVGERYMLEKQPGAKLVYTETSEDFLRMLSEGACDAAVMSRLTAVSMIDRFGLKNLTVLDDKVQGYDVRYCFAVQRGDALLLARLNEGIAILHRTGEFDDIYYRWFGRYEKATFTAVQLTAWVAAALALGCVVASWGFVRQRRLSRRIARQAGELSEQRSLLAALHENHPVATTVLELGVKGAVVISLNGEAGKLFGLETPSADGRTLDEAPLTEELRGYFAEIIKRWVSSPKAASFEARLPATRRLIQTDLVSLGSTGEGRQRLCVLSVDITKRRWMDHEVARSRRLRALGELVGGIAHEFNNLLTPIIATTGTLRAERATDVALSNDLSTVENAARQASELTRRLLTFGRKGDERAQRVLVSDAVTNCFALLKPTVDRRIEWTTQAQPGLLPILFNPIDLNQIVLNLVLNSRDTLMEKLSQRIEDENWRPRLTVSVSELPGTAYVSRGSVAGRELLAWQRLVVEDNGHGIPPEMIERIFEPFFTTKEVGKGTGLGLATVWHLVTDAGGHVAIESQPGKGTKVDVAFPRWREIEDKAPAAARAVPSGTAAKPCRILIAEDEAIVAQTLKALLNRMGHTVTHMPDGAEAWEHLSAERTTENYDALLIDVNMPRMSGVDLVRRVRTTTFAGRIVVMSGRVADEDMRQLKELGIDVVLAKPFTMSDLTAALRG